MDRQHVSPEGVYANRTPTATEPSVDLLSNLSGPAAGNQMGYPSVQHTTSAGPSGEYQSLSSFQHDAYRHEHMPSMMESVPRFTDSTQRTSQPQHHQIGLYSYSPATSYPDMSSNIHSNSGTTSSHDQAAARSFSISTDLYSSDTQIAPISRGYRQSTSGAAPMSSLDELRLADPMVVNYRQSMTSYHRRESESLLRRQRPQSIRQLTSHDSHPPEQMQAHNPYSHASPILEGIDSRRSSVIPDIYLDERAHHGQQRNLTTLEYGIAANAQSARQYPSGGDNSSLATSGILGRPADASGLMQFSGDSYSTSHASSSIPMSNSHPRHLYAGDIGGAHPQQPQYQPRGDVQALSPDGNRQEDRHQSRMTHLKRTPQSERQQLHQRHQYHYEQPHSPDSETGVDVRHSTRRGV